MLFYTYAYLRINGTPYYIGKGHGNRAFKFHGKHIEVPKDKSRILFLKTGLKEEDAFCHEVYMIAVFGRKDINTGILHNRTEGGEGCSNPSEKTRQKMRDKKVGRKLTALHKEKVSQAIRGENHPMHGKNHSQESIRKMSEASSGEKNSNYGKSRDDKTRRKISEAMTGENNHMYGKKNPGVLWWNNGVKNTRSKECPGNGWNRGRLKRMKN